MSIDIDTVTTTSFRNLIEEKFLNWAMSKSLSYRILYVIYIKALFHNNFLANIGKAKKGYEIDILCDYLDIDEVVFFEHLVLRPALDNYITDKKVYEYLCESCEDYDMYDALNRTRQNQYIVLREVFDEITNDVYSFMEAAA